MLSSYRYERIVVVTVLSTLKTEENGPNFRYNQTVAPSARTVREGSMNEKNEFKTDRQAPYIDYV